MRLFAGSFKGFIQSLFTISASTSKYWESGHNGTEHATMEVLTNAQNTPDDRVQAPLFP